MILEKTFIFNAEKSKVWDALVNPEMTKKYMFGCVPITDWKVGSAISWQGEADGVVYVIGQVVKFEPETLLSTTTFNPHEGFEDIPENYLTGEYHLSYENGQTTVKIVQRDFSSVANGEKRFEEAGPAWDMAMNGLKNILESE